MYLYLIDELTGEPIRADDWPITITGPLETVPKLFPLMQVGMRAMFFCDGKVGLSRMFGFPAKRVPIAWLEGAQESVELLNEECSVEQLWHRACTSRGRYRGSSLRTFVDFLNKNDPGLSKNEHGDFAGLHHIGDPEDGTALWTTLTDPIDIENALKERAKQRRDKGKLEHNEHNVQKKVKEQRTHNEHNVQKKVKENTDTSAAAKQDDPAVTEGDNCCTKLMMLFGY